MTTRLAVRVGEKRFAVPLERVREAARLAGIAPLPGAPDAIAGVALVRGEPFGILDVARALGAKERSSLAPGSPLVVLSDRSSALLVDRIDGVEDDSDTPLLDVDALFERKA
jgi:purine-binding chemotaxis protein CheW